MRWLALLSLLLVPVVTFAASPEPSPAAMAIYDEGKRLYDGKDYAGALERFDRCAVMEPEVARWQYNRGLALKKVKRDGEAREAFHRAQAIDPAYKAREIGEKLAELGDQPVVPLAPVQGEAPPAPSPSGTTFSTEKSASGDPFGCLCCLVASGGLGYGLWKLVRRLTRSAPGPAARVQQGSTLTREQRDAIETRSRELAGRLSKLEHGLSLGEDAELRAQVDRAAANLRAARQSFQRENADESTSKAVAGGLQRAAEAIDLGEVRLGTLRGPAGLTAQGERRGCFFCARPLPTPESRHALGIQDGARQVAVEACATCARGVQSGQAPKVTMVAGQHWSQAPAFDPYLHAYAPPAGVTEAPPWRLDAGAIAAAAGGVAVAAVAGAALLDLANARSAGLAMEATAAAAMSAGSRRNRSSSSDSSTWQDNS